MAKQISLTKDEVQQIINIIKKYKTIIRVVLYGSRARNDNKKFSDVDLCIVQDKPIEINTFANIIEDFEELEIPYFVHIIQFSNIKNEKLKNNILRDGVVIWSRD